MVRFKFMVEAHTAEGQALSIELEAGDAAVQVVLV